MAKICGIFTFDEQNTRIRFAEQNSDFEIAHSDSKLSIVADVVLTNRTELCKKFGVLNSEREIFTDTRLILEAYEKWGEDCPNHLVGDFAFAIWDEPHKKLFCSRDHFGAKTLFYYKDRERFLFASRPADILSFEKVEKKFNKNKLAIYILPEPHTIANDQSWYENIIPFPAGTSLTVNKDGVKSRRFWKPEFKKVLPYKKDEEILEAFRELLFEIIEARLPTDSPAASLLSGGLDSSSIVSIAAKILEKQNREINVFAGVLADENDKQFSDERFFIDQFKSFPNVKINYVSADGAGPFSNLEEFFETYDTPYITSRHYLYTTFSREAGNIGATTLFDGVFGEMGATSHVWGGYAEMFANFRWLKLWRELKLRKKYYDDSIKYNIRANVINPVLPQFLLNLRHGKRQNETSPNKYHPLQKDFARELFNNTDLKQHLHRRIAPDHRKNQINDLVFLQEKMADYFPINDNSVEIQCPLLDKRLIEFTAAAPLRLKIKDGYYRYLIRAALDKILPPKIQWRTSKTPFSPDYLRRFNSQIKMVRELLADVKPNDPIREILDINKIDKWANLPVKDTERYTINETIARDYLPQAVYLIYFLRTFSEFRP